MKYTPINVTEYQRSGPERQQGLSPRWLLAAPHRLFFFLGTFELLIALAVWAMELAHRQFAGVPSLLAQLTPPMTGGLGHSFSLAFGGFAAYMFGFGFTALPRWLSRPPVRAADCLVVAIPHGIGIALIVFGFAAAGLALTLFAWTAFIVQLWRKVLEGPHIDKRHAWLVAYAFGCGWLGLVCSNVGLWADSPQLLRWAQCAAFWGMLIPVNLIVSHRMLPFFTRNLMPFGELWQPFGVLYLLLAATIIYGVASQVSEPSVAALAAIFAAAAAFACSYRWHIRGVGKHRLLAMLHIAHAWVFIGFALAALQQVGAMAGWHVLGLAPVHAMGIGFALCIALAMVSRVTLGHSGRNVIADPLTWYLFLALQGIATMRVLADVAPTTVWTQPLLFGIGLSALTVIALWAKRYMPIYLAPRKDGVAG